MRKLLILLCAALCLIPAAAAVEALVIPAGTESIGDEAFCDLSAFDEVILPDGLKSIGDRAFAGSTIRRVRLPDSLESIGENAFPEGIVGYGSAGSWASAWFAEQEGLVYEADFGTPETVDETVWEKIWLEEAWCIYPDGKVHAGDLSALCARWIAWPTEDDEEEEETVLGIFLSSAEALSVKDIRREDIYRFSFEIDTLALPDYSGGTVEVAEDLPEGTVSTEDPDEIISYLVKAKKSKKPSGGGGGSGGGTVRIVHAKEQHQTDHGYDQLSLKELAEGTTVPMTVLTLSGEEESLSLTRGGEAATFLPALLSWDPSEEESESSESESGALNTLLLETIPPEAAADPENAGTAESTPAPEAEDIPEEEAFQWDFGGDLLRRLKRSSISYLALKAGDQIVVFPTEGFLAGEEYDELKSAGTASHLFAYTVSMSRPEEPESPGFDPADAVEITVSVSEKTFLLTQEEDEPLHTQNIRFLPGSAMRIIIGETEENES